MSEQRLDFDVDRTKDIRRAHLASLTPLELARSTDPLAVRIASDRRQRFAGERNGSKARSFYLAEQALLRARDGNIDQVAGFLRTLGSLSLQSEVMGTDRNK